MDLKATPEAGDPAGKSSRFVGKHEHLGKEQEFEGTLSGVVDGKPYAGDFKEAKEGHADKHSKLTDTPDGDHQVLFGLWLAQEKEGRLGRPTILED